MWKDIPGWSGLYQAHPDGFIRSVRRKIIVKGSFKNIGGDVLTPTVNDRGYHVVTLSRRGRSITKSVHTLMALTFHGVKPAGMQVLHGNDVKTDNRAINLRYGTKRMNYEDAIKNGRIKDALKGAAHPKAALKASQVAWIRQNKHISPKRLAAMFKVSVSTIRSLLSNKSY